MEGFISAAEILSGKEIIFEKSTFYVPNILRYANSRRFDDQSFRDWLHRGHIARAVHQNEVVLGRYPKNTTLFGYAAYAISVQDLWVREQTAPWFQWEADRLFELASPKHVYKEMSYPCLVAARYGETTWGHWLLEILPKVVAAEMVKPNYFYYAVPGHIFRTTSDRSYAHSVIESLDAYGISRSRLFLVEANEYVVFKELYDVVGIISDGIHPSVITMLNTQLKSWPHSTFQDKISMLRKAGGRRAIFNHESVIDVLSQHGFQNLDPAKLTFHEQIDAYRSASLLCADLGSNLAGIVFAPSNVKALVTAPSGWRDGYFVNILQRLEAHLADIRGASTYLSESRPPERVADSSYVIPISEFEDGLAKLMSEPRLDNNFTTADGLCFPKRVGTRVTINAGAKQNLDIWYLSGWAEPEGTHIWSLGKESHAEIAGATLQVLLEKAPEELYIEFQGRVFSPETDLIERRLEIWLNGQMSADIVSSREIHIQMLVKKTEILDRLRISIRLTETLSPHELQVSLDTRRLGFALEKIIFGWMIFG